MRQSPFSLPEALSNQRSGCSHPDLWAPTDLMALVGKPLHEMVTLVRVNLRPIRFLNDENSHNIPLKLRTLLDVLPVLHKPLVSMLKSLPKLGLWGVAEDIACLVDTGE